MKFAGFGPGTKRKWRTMVVRDGKAVYDPPTEVKKRTPGVQHSFTAHESYSWDRHAAKHAGCVHVDGVTQVRTEAQLKKLMAWEKARGREVHWRQH